MKFLAKKPPAALGELTNAWARRLPAQPSAAFPLELASLSAFHL